MKRNLFVISIILLVLVISVVFLSVLQKKGNTTSAVSTSHTVTIQNFAFSPAAITIHAGEKVTWVNKDSVTHSATEENSMFDTGLLSTGESKTLTIAKPGVYTYHCSVHPNMTGSITVQ